MTGPPSGRPRWRRTVCVCCCCICCTIAQITKAFRELRTKIPGITGFEDGVNNSPEGKNLGFTHVYMLTFDSVASRDAYLPHPEHKKFGELLGKVGVLEDAFVVDYVAGQ